MGRIPILIFVLLLSVKVVSQQYLVKGVTTGTINGNVYDILDDSLNNRVFIAGDFTVIGGTNIKGIASFNRSNGTLNPFLVNFGASTAYSD